MRRTTALLALALTAATLVAGGAPPAGAEGPAIAAVAVGWNHSCALTSSGGVKCWGYNEMGQLGNGTKVDSPTPVDVIGLGSGVAAVAAGGNHTCAVTTAGAMKCWGANLEGQAGDGSQIDHAVPVNVAGLSTGVKQISLGAFHTCALLTTGGLKCWGLNDFGQIGDGSFATNRLTPVDVFGLTSGVAYIAAGGRHNHVLMSNGSVKSWGHNAYGQLGDGSGASSNRPVNVPALSSGVAAVTAGGRHGCALTTSGGAKCWGRDDFGQVGDGTGGNIYTPVDVFGLTSGVATIVAGRYHTCATMATDGQVKCWGSVDGAGDVGDTAIFTPQDVNVTGITQMAAGEGHTCGVTSTAGAKCWGRNDYGQLGDGGYVSTMNPVDVAFLGSKTGTSTALTSSPNPSVVGQAVTFTATVTSASGTGTPTGTVTFQEGTSILATAPVDAGGTAAFTTSSLAAGTHSVTAVYGGDTAFGGSASPIVAQAVNPATSGPVSVVVNDVSVVEGNSGSTAAVFTVSLSRATTSKVSVRVDTHNGTAVAPGDYRGLGTSVSFSPGQTVKTVSVTVKGDLTVEPDETFTLDLTKATNATITDASGVGTIVNDD